MASTVDPIENQHPSPQLYAAFSCKKWRGGQLWHRRWIGLSTCQTDLGQDTEPQISPGGQTAPGTVARCHRCMCVRVCVNGWQWEANCKALWIKALYKCSHLPFFAICHLAVLSPHQLNYCETTSCSSQVKSWHGLWGNKLSCALASYHWTYTLYFSLMLWFVTWWPWEARKYMSHAKN